MPRLLHPRQVDTSGWGAAARAAGQREALRRPWSSITARTRADGALVGVSNERGENDQSGAGLAAHGRGAAQSKRAAQGTVERCKNDASFCQSSPYVPDSTGSIPVRAAVTTVQFVVSALYEHVPYYSATVDNL